MCFGVVKKYNGLSKRTTYATIRNTQMDVPDSCALKSLGNVFRKILRIDLSLSAVLLGEVDADAGLGGGCGLFSCFFPGKIWLCT